jgi:hypothetical protein
MGLLTNQSYWADAANQIRKHRPVPKAPMADKDVLEILKIACRSLSDLVKDKDFKADLDAAIALARHSEQKGIKALPEFGGFVDEFIMAEKSVLMQAGVDMDSTEEILRYVAEMAKIQDRDKEHLDRLDEKIAFCASLACKRHDELERLHTLRPIHEDLKRAVYGVALIGIDAGAAGAAGVLFPAAVAAYPIIAGAAKATLGVSIKYGAKACWDCLKGRW